MTEPRVLVGRSAMEAPAEREVIDHGPRTLPDGHVVRHFGFGSCNVFVARESRGKRKRHHLSISHPSRAPTWSEIRDARYRFCPHRITMAMLLPPPDEYVNIGDVWHLWEVDDD